MNVDFIIPTYNRVNELKMMLSSLICQTNNRWKATVVIDDIKNDEITSMIDSLSNENIKYVFTGKRYNNWGHTPREIGKQLSECEYIIMTGDDNYYAPIFVDEVMKVAINNPVLIYWNMVHSHYNYSMFDTRPFFNQIDMGAFATRRDIAQTTKLNTTYAADGVFIDEVRKKCKANEMIKINKVLFVHN